MEVEMDHDDDVFHDIVGVLTDEEYFSKVGFDQRLLSIFSLFEKDGTYYWPINSRQGYIQRGRFRPENPEETGRLEWAIIYEQQVDTPGMIFINFGDLLAYIPVVERRKWKEHFREIRSAPRYAEKLLFFENEEDLQDVMDDWKRRVQEHDLPWFTSQENEQRAQELHYVNSCDKENHKWRDLRRLEFRREVFNKYKHNELCIVDNDSISFLRKEGKTPASTVAFRIKVSDSDRIVVEARDFIYVPPIERIHWLSHQIYR
jgi:hypothetical protein